MQRDHRYPQRRGDGVITFTESGQTSQLHDNLHGVFSFDPDDPATASASGHFVAQRREIAESTELSRVTDTQHTSVHTADGTNFPIQIGTRLVFADGGVVVNVDRLKCEGQFGA